MFRLFFAKLSVKGLEGYDPKKPCIIISNHQSLVDIPTVYEVFSGPVKMLGKAELFKIPFFGWALTAAGLIPVDRGNREAATKTIELTKKRLSEGVQIWMAPEGTRSVDGKLGAFKGGAFRMAADLNLPIVGLVLNGTKDVLRKKSFLVNPFQQINAVVLPAVSMADVGAIDYKQFRNYFKAKFEETLADIS
ncbi:1-acyl-sn-glycerol-3-phosphate acyltransferase [bacterium]|nr:1-acyl-sn-glycerol-3-phosphate acyltransferase [bacterium]